MAPTSLQFSSFQRTAHRPFQNARFEVFLQSMQSRSWSASVVVLFALSCSTTAFATGFGESNLTTVSDESDSGREIDVGTRLVATNDVKLRDVSLSKGARVVVRGLEQKGGRIASVDVELADGKVLKHVDAGTIRKAFVVSND